MSSIGEDGPIIRRGDDHVERAYTCGPVQPFKDLLGAQVRGQGLFLREGLSALEVGSGWRIPDVGGFQSFLLRDSGIWAGSTVAGDSGSGAGRSGYQFCRTEDGDRRVRGAVFVTSEEIYVNWIADLPGRPGLAGGKIEFERDGSGSFLLPVRSSYWIVGTIARWSSGPGCTTTGSWGPVKR